MSFNENCTIGKTNSLRAKPFTCARTRVGANSQVSLRLAIQCAVAFCLTSASQPAVALPYTAPSDAQQSSNTKPDPTTKSSKTSRLGSGHPLSDAPNSTNSNNATSASRPSSPPESEAASAENDALPPALRAQPEPQDKPTTSSDFMSENRQGGNLGNHFFVPNRNANSADPNSDFQPRRRHNFRSFRQNQNSVPGEWSGGAPTPKIQIWNTGSKNTGSQSNQGANPGSNGNAHGGAGKPGANNSAE